MENIIYTSVVFSLAIIGLRIVSSKGMILYFLRMPYEWLINQKAIEQNELTEINIELSEIQDKFEDADNYQELKELAVIKKAKKRNTTDLIKIHSTCIYLLKPIIACGTCMASVWTLVISYFYFEINKWTILQIFIVACLNSIIFALYEKLEK